MGTFVLTLVLAAATLWYAVSTYKLLRLSREQFEREWRPDLRIASVQRIQAEQVHLSVANLAKPAALVKKLIIGTGGRAEQGIAPQDTETFSLRFLVGGGQIREDMTIHTQLGEYRRRYSPAPLPGSGSQWQAGFSVALVYECAGIEKQTPWRDFSATFRDYVVVDIVCPDEPSR